MKRKTTRSAPSFKGLHPASVHASTAARGASIKRGTRCEIALRRELWHRGLRYRLHAPELPGRPDIVFPSIRLAIFCDGDFWHGRDLDNSLAKLSEGHNASYWVAKIRRNVERDQENARLLEAKGWIVVRIWETDLFRAPVEAGDRICAIIAARRQIIRGQEI